MTLTYQNYQNYLARLGISEPLKADIGSLTALHNAHFRAVPFENFNMHSNESLDLDPDKLAKHLANERRGGICFEISSVLAGLFDRFGFNYRICMGRVLTPVVTPLTHQIFVISLAGRDWLFDVGFGARGPRAPVPLQHDHVHEHPVLSTKVQKCARQGWVVSIRERHDWGAGWQAVYSFHDVPAVKQDIEMAYYYTLHSPRSLLNQNRVSSIPTDKGRLSVRNKLFTEVIGDSVHTEEIVDSIHLKELLDSRFGISISDADLYFLGEAKCNIS